MELNREVIEQIVHEELTQAGQEIIRRLLDLCKEHPPVQPVLVPTCPAPSAALTPLPPNPKYQAALNSYRAGGTHSGTARLLGVSISAAKKYYNWLVAHGYLPQDETELSEMEEKVAKCIFEDRCSLREAAKRFNCSVSNIVYRRDSALRKGYIPPEE